MNGNSKPFIVPSLPRPRIFEGHAAPVAMFVTEEDLAPVLGCEIAAVDVSQAKIGVWFTEAHTHPRPEVYLCTAAGGTVVIDIDLDGEVIRLPSPFVLLIPAGVVHRFRVQDVPGHSVFLLGLFPCNSDKERNHVSSSISA